MSSDEPPRPVLLTDELRAQLNSVSTATLTSQLQRKGIRSTFLSGLKPIKPGQRMLGYAHTLRYVPLREDLNAQFSGGLNAQRRAVESMAPEEVLVMEARGEPDAGTFGDVFALRALRRGAVGMITDGAVRDTPAVAALDIAVYHGASHAATFSRAHMPLEHQIPIACAGVTVMPVVELAAASVQQEAEETWALERVDAGESTTGVFPVSKERRPEFEAWYAARQSSQPKQPQSAERAE
jgi:5-oxopent-3-ene-1,2,5-tricarboxylate decarboxylase/2-hydroxyhepta-2,4-diene-1,7-dioate isomerase